MAILAGVGRRDERSLTDRRTGLRGFQDGEVEEEEDNEVAEVAAVVGGTSSDFKVAD